MTATTAPPALDQQPIAAPARLIAPPDTLVATRASLHRLAEHVIAPARRAATGRIGLRAIPGGFGTPVFGDQRRIAVLGTELVVSDAHGERRAPITTLVAGAELVGLASLAGGPDLDAEPLVVDPAAAAVLADFYALGAATLLALRAQAGADAEPSLIQLWPEHFDIAVDLGAAPAGARANYGFSPGDDAHPEPYAYVGPWGAVAGGPLWNAVGFTGAELPYADLAAAADPAALALEFMAERRRALHT